MTKPEQPTMTQKVIGTSWSTGLPVVIGRFRVTPVEPGIYSYSIVQYPYAGDESQPVLLDRDERWPYRLDNSVNGALLRLIEQFSYSDSTWAAKYRSELRGAWQDVFDSTAWLRQEFTDYSQPATRFDFVRYRIEERRLAFGEDELSVTCGGFIGNWGPRYAVAVVHRDGPDTTVLDGQPLESVMGSGGATDLDSMVRSALGQLIRAGEWVGRYRLTGTTSEQAFDSSGFGVETVDWAFLNLAELHQARDDLSRSIGPEL